ncbi:MAG: DoxX family protein [Minisyncoccota bacterium]
MNTVSLFPSLFDYSFLAIGILRITLGLIVIGFAYTNTFKGRADTLAFFEKLRIRPANIFLKIAVGIELLMGILLTLGYYTQAAALVAGVLMSLVALIKWHRPNLLPHNTAAFYLLLAVVSFTLLFIGPGAFAFDLPL